MINASIFQQYIYFLKFNLIQSNNRFISWLRKIPLIKYLIPIGIYRSFQMKQVISMMIIFIQFLLGIIGKLFAILPLILFVKLIPILQEWSLAPISQFEQLDWIRLAYWWLLFIGMSKLFSMLFTKSFSLELQDYTAYFQLNRRTLWQGYLWMTFLHRCLLHLFPLWLIVLMANHRLLFFMCFSGYLAFFVLSQWVSRKFYQKKFKTATKMIYFILSLLAVFGIGMMINQLSEQLLSSNTLILLASSLFIVMIIIFQGKIQRFEIEEDYYRTMLENRFELDNEAEEAKEIMKNADVIEATSIQSEMRVNHNQTFEGLKGQAYLNAVLFDRYQKVFSKKLKWRIFGGSIIVFCAVMILTVLRMMNIIVLNDLSQLIQRVLPLVLLAIYGLSLGKVIVRVCFVNCDLAMLNYPFYREKSSILNGFNNRLWRTIKLNTPIVVIIMLGYLILFLLNPGIILAQDLFLIIFLLLSIHLLVSFQDLFLYYLLQPFSREMKIQSSLYRIISSVTYILFLNFDDIYESIKFNGLVYFALGVVIYIFMGYVMILIFAPKTFKLKD